MNWATVVQAIQWFFLLYFIVLSLSYVSLNLISIVSLSHYMSTRSMENLPPVYSNFELPISLIVPAYNEEATIAASVRAMLQLSYPEFEVVVVNDGSADATLETLIREFSMAPFPEAYRVRLQTQPVNAVYHSTIHPNLRLIDKQNGGKADALNAGINGSLYPLFCCVDADSILQRDSLQRLVQPFLEDASTVACGGTVRIANGCRISGGYLSRVGLPTSPLVLLQIVEYLRAFLFGRLGWSPLNALLIISGAFGLFRKETVIAAGGYRSDTVGEDMELVVRLHRTLRLDGKRYRITFLPDPVCWTEAPEDLRTLQNQRIRWQRGLAESLMMNRRLLFHPKGGAAGWLAFPFMVVFEWLGPLLEALGYGLMVFFFLTQMISLEALGAFLLAAIGFGLLLSVNALLLEELSFHLYERPSQLVVLFLVAVMENFGYRQLNSVWRLIGLMRWALGGKAHWGEMKRIGRGAG